jgi:hypothetical protein
MALPQEVTGQLLDVRRQLAFRSDVTVNELIFYDVAGDEIQRIDHFWHVENPRTRRDETYETITFIVVEDGEDLTDLMGSVRSLRYISVDEDETPTTSEAHYTKKIPEPPLGKNRRWIISTTQQSFVGEFFTPPGQR